MTHHEDDDENKKVIEQSRLISFLQYNVLKQTADKNLYTTKKVRLPHKGRYRPPTFLKATAAVAVPAGTSIGSGIAAMGTAALAGAKGLGVLTLVVIGLAAAFAIAGCYTSFLL